MRVDQERRGMAAPQYYFRRRLDLGESLPAIGAGVAAGLVGFYLARLFLQRTPLAPQDGIPVVGERGAIVRRPARARSRA
jgi:hypothetical protein